MTYKHHHHLLAHLVTQHHAHKEFRFSNHFSTDSAYNAVRRQGREEIVSLLQSQLAETRDLLVRMQGSLSHEQYRLVLDKIGLLEEKIKEKREKLDL